MFITTLLTLYYRKQALKIETKSSYDVTILFRNLYHRFRHMAKMQGAKMRLHRMRLQRAILHRMRLQRVILHKMRLQRVILQGMWLQMTKLHRMRLRRIGQQRLHLPTQGHLVPQRPLYSLLLYCIAVSHAQISFMIFYESHQSVKSEIIKTVFSSK